jgi:DNA-binding response OmpR family regulator
MSAPLQILIADDDPVSRRALEAMLHGWGYVVVAVDDGGAAWEELSRQEGGPALAILDWVMPGADGLTLCRRLRQEGPRTPPYVILLTARGDSEDVVAGLESGADDYLVKPYRRDELHARVRAGLRVASLQRSLAERVRELEDALARVHRLQGLLPICSYCKRIRTDENYWQQVEEYIADRSAARFTHGICPGCYDNLMRQIDKPAEE